MVQDLQSVVRDKASDILTPIEQILRNALELDTMFRKAKADFFLISHEYAKIEQYNPETMEEREGPGAPGALEQCVSNGLDIIIVPGLGKRGNSDGGNYSSTLILGKMEVICNVGRWLYGDEDDLVEDDVDPIA